MGDKMTLKTAPLTEKQEQFERDNFWAKILCAFAYDPPARFYGSSVGRADYKPMERLGVFIKDTPDMTAFCDRCHDDTPVEVHKNKDGKTTYWRVCCFPVKRINPKNFRVWLVEPKPVFDSFREQVGIKGAIDEIIPEQAWKWGRCGQQSFVYVRRVTEDDLKQVAAVLKRFPESIFITPRTCYLETLDIVLPNRGIAFDEISSLDENYQIQWDLEKINAAIEPEVRQSLQTQRRRVNRIDRLTAVMKEHYRTAREYLRLTGEIFPRIKQAELGKRAGLSQDAVSRCLNDPKAIVLRALWDNAENEKSVKNFK